MNILETRDEIIPARQATLSCESLARSGMLVGLARDSYLALSDEIEHQINIWTSRPYSPDIVEIPRPLTRSLGPCRSDITFSSLSATHRRRSRLSFATCQRGARLRLNQTRNLSFSSIANSAPGGVSRSESGLQYGLGPSFATQCRSPTGSRTPKGVWLPD